MFNYFTDNNQIKYLPDNDLSIVYNSPKCNAFVSNHKIKWQFKNNAYCNALIKNEMYGHNKYSASRVYWHC